MGQEPAANIVPSLHEAFEAFNASARRLSRAYSELEARFQELNRELEETNARLQQHLKEKQRLQHYLESILNSMSPGIVVFDLEGRITLFNRSAERLTGWRTPEVVGRASSEIFGDAAYHEPEARYEHDVSPDWLPEGKVIPLDIRTELVKDINGELIGVLLLMEDISERKHLEEQVRRTNRLAALGKMAAEIAHEVRNPLAAMQIYTRLLQQDLEGENRRIADDLMASIHSLELISGNMLSLTREVAPRFEQIDLVQVFENALEFSIYALEENDIELIRNYPAEGLICEADFEQLKQVVLNLLLNAIQAMPTGGTLEICARQTDDRYLTWQIRDTGCGIPTEHLDRIFTPFFSSKRSGTGLGLHTVERILQAHSAPISADSQVGKGTVFTIRLPVRQNQRQGKSHVLTRSGGATKEPNDEGKPSPDCRR